VSYYFSSVLNAVYDLSSRSAIFCAVCRDPLTVSDLNLGGTNLSCLAEFGGPVMPWVALGGFSSKPLICFSLIVGCTFSMISAYC
jgi:hypothetical protein